MTELEKSESFTAKRTERTERKEQNVHLNDKLTIVKIILLLCTNQKKLFYSL